MYLIYCFILLCDIRLIFTAADNSHYLYAAFSNDDVSYYPKQSEYLDIDLLNDEASPVPSSSSFSTNIVKRETSKNGAPTASPSSSYSEPATNTSSVPHEHVEVHSTPDTHPNVTQPSPSKPTPSTRYSVSPGSSGVPTNVTISPSKNASSVHQDPLPCDPAVCVLPECYCPDESLTQITKDPQRPMFDINNDTLKQNNISKTYQDSHIYYNSTRTDDPVIAQQYWVDMSSKRPDVITHLMLSKSHRHAVTVPLPFKFQFYGHEIDKVTIATGGFLYTGDYVHSWLAATQFIAPLMANFDPSLSNDSFIKYVHNDTTFTVLWENVSLQDQPAGGNFTFQVTLKSNGDIIFVYLNLPNITAEITDHYHPVKVGLSDAYILDRTIFFVRRKTIFEYHRLQFDKKELKNGTVIYLKPLPTCQNKTTCESCLAKDVSFDCQWCDNRCSTGVDRRRHDWVKKDCDKKKINETKYCNEKVPTPGARKFEGAVDNNNSGNNSSSYVLVSVISIGCISTLLIWIMYAYRNPHSSSGQLLIRYRPSQWSSWRKGEARYTAATIHM